MKSSIVLRETYGKATYGGKGVSLNFVEPIAWWQERDGQVMDPYALYLRYSMTFRAMRPIPTSRRPVQELKEGGAAMAAYARLQFEDLSGYSPRKHRERPTSILRAGHAGDGDGNPSMGPHGGYLLEDLTWAAHASVLSFLGPGSGLIERLPRR